MIRGRRKGDRPGAVVVAAAFALMLTVVVPATSVPAAADVGLPGAPAAPTATAGPDSADVTWAAPSDDGGSPITGYAVTPSIGSTIYASQTFDASTTTRTLTNLFRGYTYRFTVAAVTAEGTGPASPPSNAVIPYGPPGRPGNNGYPQLSKTPGTVSWQATVSWGPANQNGDPIISYVATLLLGSTQQSVVTVGPDVRQAVFTGLIRGSTYTVTVVATNTHGAGLPLTVGPFTPADPPGAVIITTVTGSTGQAVVRYTDAADDGGLPIQYHIITPYLDGVALPFQYHFDDLETKGEAYVSGLSDGTLYTFTVAAESNAGFGPPSAMSGAVLPPFPTLPTFVQTMSQGFLGRLPTNMEQLIEVDALEAGADPADFMASLRRSEDATANVDPTARLYFSYFLRMPDATGLTTWTERKRAGMSLQAISDLFARSDEFKHRYGSLTDGQFVDLVYHNVLGRAADAGGHAYWVGQLSSGHQTRGQVMVGFSESAENKTKSQPSVDTAVSWISVLGASPPTASFTQWVTDLTSGAKTVLDLESALLAMLSAPPMPQFPTAVPGNGEVFLSWWVNASAAPITDYIITPYIGQTALPSRRFAAPTRTATITGLTNGTTYSFQIAPENRVGVGVAAWTASVIAGNAGPPGSISITPGDKSVSASWTAATPNASTISGYFVGVYRGNTLRNGTTVGPSQRSQTLDGIVNGVLYNVRVYAITNYGAGTLIISPSFVPTAG